MASTSATRLDDVPHQQQHMMAPDDSDFMESDNEARSEDEEIEAVLLAELPRTPTQASPSRRPSPLKKQEAGRVWPCHPLIRVHKRLWFTWFTDPTPSEEELNLDNGKQAAWTKWDNATIDAAETKVERLHWFTVDQDLVYLSFWFDWGPLNVAMFYRFCLHVHHLLTDPDMQDATLVLYTSHMPAQKANAALLVTLYAMIIGKVAPADAFFPISELEFKPFRDAGYGRPDYDLSIQDILYGIHRAINSELLDLTSFNLDEYEKYEQVQHGDWNWITPSFIAFASPNDRDYVEALRLNNGTIPASQSFAPKAYSTFANTIRYFKERRVKLVVRLNNPLYDKTAFEEAGIEHVDMYFDDGSNPSEEILRDFIARADAVIADNGVVAVHCKAGLGRTGVLIGAYLIWRYGFTAGEVIGFMRIMRPGCVVGPQQHFMYQNFVEWVKWGVRDTALKEARKLVEAEAHHVPRSSRSSLKRRAEESDSDDADDDADDDNDSDNQRRRRKQKPRTSTEQEQSAPPLGPQTPKPRRARDAPHVPMAKPTPCVGQPRKSPSPSRKRPAIQAPATVARLELTSRSYPTASSRSYDAAHAAGMLMLHHARPTTTTTATTTNGVTARPETVVVRADDATSARRAMPDSPTSVSGSESADDLPFSPGRGAGGDGVLLESRVNVVGGSTTPRSAPKVALANMTPSPMVRSRTVVSRGATSPEIRASPTVRDRYRLRDASKSPPPMLPLPPKSPVKSSSKSDAEVLGVMECIPQQHSSPQAKIRQPTTSAHTSPVARTYYSPVNRGAIKDENRSPSVQHAPVQTKVVKAALSTAVTAPNGPRVLPAAMRAKTPVQSASNGTATTRRGDPSVVVAKIPSVPQVRSTVLRAQKSAADLRSARPHPARVTTAGAGRSVSGTSTCSTAATMSGGAEGGVGVTAQPVRPKSRLMAPTAASAARASATLNATAPTKRPSSRTLSTTAHRTAAAHSRP